MMTQRNTAIKIPLLRFVLWRMIPCNHPTNDQLSTALKYSLGARPSMARAGTDEWLCGMGRSIGVDSFWPRREGSRGHGVRTSCDRQSASAHFLSRISDDLECRCRSFIRSRVDRGDLESVHPQRCYAAHARPRLLRPIADQPRSWPRQTNNFKSCNDYGFGNPSRPWRRSRKVHGGTGPAVAHGRPMCRSRGACQIHRFHRFN